MAENTTEPGAIYLNVDLEIRSLSDLKPLADALSPNLFVLHVGKIRREFFLSVETPGIPLPPDTAIMNLARTISALPQSVRKHWKEASDLVFDIGVEKTTHRGAFALALHPETVKTVAKLNARVAITLYPPVTEQRRLANKPLKMTGGRGRRPVIFNGKAFRKE